MSIIKMPSEDLQMSQTEIWERNLKQYAKENGFEKNLQNAAFYFTDDTYPAEPEKMPLLLARIALVSPNKKLDQKYVLLQTYFDNGYLSTIDIASMPLGYHREIITKYMQRILTSELSRQPDFLFDESRAGSRYLTGGGWLEAEDKKARLSGSSGDFGDQISIHSSNDIASYLLAESGLFDNVEGDKESGRKYIERCLDVMSKHKLTEEFYSALVDMYELENIRHDRHVSGHILGSLHMMKSIDKAYNEGKNIISVLVEEMTEGIGREMLIRGVAENIRKRKK